jgi:isopenicillin N synthase-like dioxygenase
MNSNRDFSTIPQIDVSALVERRVADYPIVAAQIRAAALEVGFFYVTGHGVAPALFDELIGATQRFFALPYAEKMKIYIGLSKNHRGYVPEGEEVFAGSTKDKKEAFDLSIELSADDPDYRAGNPLLGPNQWPALPGFAASVLQYYDGVFEFGRTLMRGFALALGEAPEHFDPVITRPPSQLRLIHYPYNPEAEDSVGIGAHTDYECFTVLHATAPGLEIMNGSGEWIEAPPLPGAFIINIGDMMEILSNGVFVATTHRVRKAKSERYSFPLFFTLDYHTQVTPLERFVTVERPARSGLVAGEHLFAQTAQSFSYQKARLARGEISLPKAAVGLSSFGQEARRDTRQP